MVLKTKEGYQKSNKYQKDQANLYYWDKFQTLRAGVALPAVSLMKLSCMEGAPVRVVARSSSISSDDGEGVDLLRFDLRKVAKKIFGPLKQSLLSKIEAQTHLNVIFDTD